MTSAFCRLAAVALCLLGGSLHASAQAPQTAIPWLSESIEADDTQVQPGGDRPGFALDAITVTPLTGADQGNIGILGNDVTGFAPDLWGETPAAEVRDLILNHPGSGPHTAKTLFRRILLAQSSPPLDGSDTSSILLARIDKLLDRGALEEAASLIELADPESPALFRRWFDISVLTDNAEAPCQALSHNPALSPTLPARVFCLARLGDWNAAEITLTLGKDVGSISPDQEELLARFLDPEVFEGAPNPEPIEPLTPLNYLLREAVGLPRPGTQLPLAFLHHDLNEHVPMRTRIEAAERLAAAGSLPVPVLFDAYRSGTPSASGGIWDRAAAIQALDRAFLADDSARVALALVEADRQMTRRGLRVELAKEYAEKLPAIETGGLDRASGNIVFELLLLAGLPEQAAAITGNRATPSQRALLTLAGLPDESTTRPSGRIGTALDALSGTPNLIGTRGQDLIAQLNSNQQGKAMLLALDLLSTGHIVGPKAMSAGLHALNAAGQTEAARQIALELLLAAGPMT